MSQLNLYPNASTIDAVNDELVIWTNSLSAVQNINRNTLLNLSSQPVGLTDSQTLTNKTLTSPTVSSPTFSGTLAGTYTIGGTPTFPASVTQNTVSQTLTNKTLTSPTITSPTITNATISADAVTGYTTSNTGTIYGIGITGGNISSALTATSTVTVNGLITGTSGLTVSGGVTQLLPTLKNPYKFNVYRNSAWTMASATYGLVTFDTVTFDTGTNYSTSTGKFTPPINGFYQFSWNIAGQMTTGLAYVAAIYKNGGAVAYGSGGIQGASTAGAYSGGSVMLQLVTTDYIQIYFYGSGLAGATGANTTFNGFLVSAA